MSPDYSPRKWQIPLVIVKNHTYSTALGETIPLIVFGTIFSTFFVVFLQQRLYHFPYPYNFRLDKLQ